MTTEDSKTPSLREVAQMALDSLKDLIDISMKHEQMVDREYGSGCASVAEMEAKCKFTDELYAARSASETLRAALAVPEAEPLDGIAPSNGYAMIGWTPGNIARPSDKLYAEPQSAKPAPVERQPLTSEALFDLALTEVNRESDVVVLACNLVRATEAAHGIKGAA